MKLRRYWYLALVFGFILGIRDGNIALWKDGSSEPVRVFPYRAELLPRADQAALENGIYIEKKEDLMALLEDYLS